MVSVFAAPAVDDAERPFSIGQERVRVLVLGEMGLVSSTLQKGQAGVRHQYHQSREL